MVKKIIDNKVSLDNERYTSSLKMKSIKIPLKFEQIDFNETVYKLSKPLIVDAIVKKGRPISISVKELGIFAYGKTIEEAQLNFSDKIFRLSRGFIGIQDLLC